MLCNYALGTQILLRFGHGCAIVCPRNTNVLMVWAWMHYLSYVVCSRNTNAIVVWAWMRLSSYALGTRTLSWFGHGCTSNRMLAEHERSYGLGMDALVIVCSPNTNAIVVWAWMRLSSYALGTRTLAWCGNGCTCYRM